MYKEILKESSNVIEVMKILSNKKRLLLLCSLSEWEKNVSQIIKNTNISQSQTSQFLAKLKLQWIVESKQEWKEIFYKIKDKKIINMIENIKNLYCKI